MNTRVREEEWSGLMKAAIAGDGSAYRLLLQSLTEVLRGSARRGFARAGLGSSEVEDVVQETLLAIHLKRHTWRQEDPIGPWVMTIVRHKLIDSLRRRGRHIHVPIDDVIEFLPASEPDPGLSEREADKLLEVLSEGQRRVVRAVTVEGITIREAAARLGMTEGAVRVSLHRGLAALARAHREIEQ